MLNRKTQNKEGKIRRRKSRRHEKKKMKDKVHGSLYKCYVFLCRV